MKNYIEEFNNLFNSDTNEIKGSLRAKIYCLINQWYKTGCYVDCFITFTRLGTFDDNLNKIYQSSIYLWAKEALNNKNIPLAHCLLTQIIDYKDSAIILQNINEKFDEILNNFNEINSIEDLYQFRRALLSNELGHFSWKHSIAIYIQRLLKKYRQPCNDKFFTLSLLTNRVELHNSLSKMANYQQEYIDRIQEKLDFCLNNISEEKISSKFLKDFKKLVYKSSKLKYNILGNLEPYYKRLVYKKREAEQRSQDLLQLEKPFKELDEILKENNGTVYSINIILEKILYFDKDLIRECEEKYFNKHMEIIKNNLNFSTKKQLQLSKCLLLFLMHIYDKDDNKNELCLKYLNECNTKMYNQAENEEDFNEWASDLIKNPNTEEYEKFKKKIRIFGAHYRNHYYYLPKPLSHLITQSWNGHNINFSCETLWFRYANTLGNDLMFNVLCSHKKVVFFDIETTGLHPICDKIIEFAYVIYDGLDVKYKNFYQVECAKNKKEKEESFLIKLPNDRTLSDTIISLTGISNDMLQKHGIDKSEAKDKIIKLFKENKDALFVAYNATFDLSFIFDFLKEDAYILYDIDILDPYYAIKTSVNTWQDTQFSNYTLESIIDVFGISKYARNSHRAIDDANALFFILREYEKFGYGEHLISSINKLYYPENLQYTLPQIEYQKY